MAASVPVGSEVAAILAYRGGPSLMTGSDLGPQAETKIIRTNMTIPKER
jgi:hypothetical protein